MGGLAIAALGWSLSSGADRALAIDICVLTRPATWQDYYKHYEARVVGCNGLSEAAGGLIGAGLIASCGLRSTLWAQAAVYMVMLALAGRIREPHRQRQHLAPPHLGRTLWSLRQRPHLLNVMVFAGLIGSVTTVLYQLAPLYYSAIRYQGEPLPAGWFGVIWAGYVALTWEYRRFFFDRFTSRLGHYGSLAALVVLSVACYLMLAITVSPAGLVVIAALFFVRPMQQPLTAQHLGRLAQEDERATVLSVGRLLQYAMPGLFAWIIGGAINQYGLAFGFSLAAGLFGSLAGLALLAAYRGDSQTQHPELS
jgi:hypothetical protein